MRKKTARSIGEISDIVSQARAEWKVKEEKEIWFRGENAKYLSSTLRPKLYRHIPANINIVSKAILRKEHLMHDEFSRCGTQLYEHDHVEDWDWYFLMQHHGAPTRLLDWSDGALMAVHFAVNENDADSKGAYVYLLDPYQLNDEIDELPEIELVEKTWKSHREYKKKCGETWPRDWDQIYIPGMHSIYAQKSHQTVSVAKKPLEPELPNAPLVLEFPQITRRVAAQRSRFMAYGRDKNWLTRWAAREQAHLWRIFIPKSTMPLIRTQLRDAGLTESVIFPDLDGLGRELNQLWDTLKKRRSLSK